MNFIQRLWGRTFSQHHSAKCFTTSRKVIISSFHLTHPDYDLGFEETDKTMLNELNQVMEMKNTGIMMDDVPNNKENSMDFDPMNDSFG